MRHLVEFRDEDLGAEEGPKIGDDVTVSSFEAGQKVKVSGVSIGKGFQGGIKRHNFSRGPVSHGSHNVRAPGSIGASAFPARVFKGMRMPGQMGNKRVTQKGLEIADVDAERNLLLIKGSVPGSRNAVVEVRTDGDR
jgi:large subunit ribosomal protein L3